MTINKGKLASWLEKKYAEWQPTQDRKHRSLRAFSNWLGVSNPLIIMLINDHRDTISSETANLIALKLGDDIYDLVGLPRPDPDLQRIKAMWPMVKEEHKAYILMVVEQATKDGQVSGSNMPTMAKTRKTTT